MNLETLTLQQEAYLVGLETYPSEYDSYDEYGKVTEFSNIEDTVHIQDMMILNPAKSVQNIKAYKEALFTNMEVSILLYMPITTTNTNIITRKPHSMILK